MKILLPQSEKKKKKDEGPEKFLDVLPGQTKLEKLQALYQSWCQCERCPLSAVRKESNGQVVFGDGNPEADILIIGEAPGENEEASGLPFVGLAGNLLNRIIGHAAIDPQVRELTREYELSKHRSSLEQEYNTQMFNWRRQNMFITNVVSCRPPDNRVPTKDETATCWDRLWNIIYVVDPMLIVVAGNTALAAISKKKGLKITKARGEIVDVPIKGRFAEYTKPVMPVFHPSYLLRVADWGVENGEVAKSIGDWHRAFKMVAFMKWQQQGIPMPDALMKNIEVL